ncbi:MAG: glycosyltransferase family 4 protein [Lachnospiraceae bacterium]|nr:glycosyltransferase family 4 protein [Lachnospiraceae bacterium]
MKVLFMVNIPAPYRVDFFNELGKSCDLTVLFEQRRDKSRNSKWEADEAAGFHAVFLEGVRMGEADAFCPGVITFLSLKKYDVIIVGAYHTPTGRFAIDYMRRKKIPFLLSTDGGMIKKDNFLKYRVKYHYIHSAFMWLAPGAAAARYLGHYGAEPDRIRSYPFTSVRECDIQKNAAQRKAELRAKLGIPYRKLLLAVGQFIPRKGFDILLRACAGLDPSVGVCLVGGKPTQEYLDICERFHLTNVRFVDFQSKESLAEYYDAADLFVHPTREDIWGLVINEALAHGLPVITTDRCLAGAEMVRDGWNGRIVPAESDALHDAIAELVLDEGKTGLFARRSLEIAEACTIEQMSRAHLEVFAEFLDRSSRFGEA